MKKNHLTPGSRVSVSSKKGTHEGMVMPNSNAKTLFLKLDSGYTIGIAQSTITSVKEVSSQKPAVHQRLKLEEKKGLPTILVIHTGGTIASKVDYATGGVTSQFSPEDLVEMVPELSELSNIRTIQLFNIFSEDMRPEYYTKIAETIKKEYKKVDGIIIGHGTDTLHYTSAALSFMLENIPIPVILVGAQRSSDRGSSDAAMNLICAAEFIKKTYFKGVAICMHENTSDESCVVLPATKVRKMHTSRRDAFQPINTKPIARINYSTRAVTMIEKAANPSSAPLFKTKIEPKVGIVKVYPGINPKVFDSFKGYKGLIIEGTGLGQMPLSGKNKPLEASIKKLAKSGTVIAMTSQCIYGRVNMDVYSRGRELQSLGIIPGQDMTTETAFIKLSWLLANFKKTEVKELFSKNLRGELKDRLLPSEFIPESFKEH